MKWAVVLAAGLGTRMRPNSARVPKPLLRVQQETLLFRHFRALEQSNHTDVVVTCSYHSQTLRLLVARARFAGLRISFSHEGARPLETAGGIRRAIEQSGAAPITVMNGDVWTDFPLADLAAPPTGGAHLLLVPNPPHNPTGDFCLSDSGQVCARAQGADTLTFSGISHFDPSALGHSDTPRLADALAPLIQAGHVTGQRCRDAWRDIGTPEAMRAGGCLDQSRTGKKN